MSNPKETQEFTKIKKDTENLIAKSVYRPLSEPVAIFLSKFNITPNQVTCISIFTSIISGLFFSAGEWKFSLWGAFFLQLSVLMDHVDGSLARFTDQASVLGKWWDDMANKLIKYFVLLGMSFGAYRQIGEPMILLLGAMAIFNITYSSFLVLFKEDLKKELGGNKSLSIMPEGQSSFFPASLIIYTIMTLGGITNLLWFPILFLATFGLIWIKQIRNIFKAFQK